MRTSLNGRKLITLEEGRARYDSSTGLYFPYRDPEGYWTIGVGHLIRPDEDFAAGISAERVDQLLSADLIKCDIAIDGIKAPRALNQNQHDCLASWLFNVGTGWARADKSSVVRAIEAGEYERVPDLLLLYDMAGGQHRDYLKARRRREGKLWSTPVQDDLDQVYEAAHKAAELRFSRIELLSEDDLSDDDDEETPTMVRREV